MKKRLWVLPLLTLYFVTGCSSLDWHTRNAPSDFVPGTQVLGLVIEIAPRDAVLEGRGLFADWYGDLLSAGYSDSDVVDDSEISAWAYCYGHNAGVPDCAHHGHYLAHVPVNLRSSLQSYSAPGTGDLVQIELTANKDGVLIGKVVSVYRKSGAWNDCREAELQVTSGVISSLTYGPPHASWIECGSLEADGWQRNPVDGAPINDGPPVSVWMKLPGSEMK